MWDTGRVQAASGIQYQFYVKHYDEPSEVFGLNGGKISKLLIRKLGETRDLASYDRGWCIKPTNDEVRMVLDIILAKYAEEAE